MPSIVSGACAGSSAQLLTIPLFYRNIRNHVGQSSHDLRMRYSPALFGWLGLRGSILGMTHLSLYNTMINFLEQPLDPFGTAAENADMKVRKFVMYDSIPVNEMSTGDRLLNKLGMVGFFDQGRD